MSETNNDNNRSSKPYSLENKISSVHFGGPVLLRTNNTVFPKDSPTGCESEGNHPNFCEAQLLFCATEPTETCCSVKTLASAQACALFTLK